MAVSCKIILSAVVGLCFWQTGANCAPQPQRETGVQLAELTKAIEQNPKSASALVSRGHFYLKIFDEERAQADLLRAVKVDPNCGEAHKLLGDSYRMQGKTDAALHEYESCILGTNTGIASRGAKAAFKMLEAQKRYADAIKYLTLYLDRHKRSDWRLEALSFRARCYRETGNTKLALQDLETADKESGTVTQRMAGEHARLCKRLKKYDEAVIWYGKCISLLQREREQVKDLPELLRERSECYTQMHKPDMAKRDLQAASAVDKDVYGSALFRTRATED